MADLIDREAAFLVLRKAQIASCTCQIKTPDPDWHNHNCRYRILREIEAMIEHLPDADALSALPAQGVRGAKTADLIQRGKARAFERYNGEKPHFSVRDADLMGMLAAALDAALAPAEAGGVEATDLGKTEGHSAPVDALVKAAEPFAYEIDAPAMEDDRPISVRVTIGDHRRLRATLAAYRGEKP